MKQFRIRGSAGSKIMSGSVGLTDKQKERIAELAPRARGEGKPLTQNMVAEYADLIWRRDNPQLPQSAKSYCEMWVKQQIYSRRKEFISKYTIKGDMVEESSIPVIGKELGIENLSKNDEFFENEYATGMPDMLPDGFVVDAKNSWDCFSFPLFDDEIPKDENYWQGQIYMWLTGTQLAKFVYVLSDTPEKLIIGEAKSYCYKNGYDLSPDIVDEFRERMTYKDIAPEYKIKVFDVVRNDADIERLKERVLMCREYIKTLVK